MADETIDIANQFRGLPIEHLVGAPLKAASDAQIMLAQSLAEFIDKVGFQPQPKGGSELRTARQIDFSMTRPAKAQDGSINEEQVDLSVPFLALIPIPNLQVDNVAVDFQMNVQSQFSTTSGHDEKAGLDVGASGGFLFFHADVKIHGEVAHHQQQTRSSDNSSRYSIHVEAKQRPPSEGLMKVLDILNTACAPRAVIPLSAPQPRSQPAAPQLPAAPVPPAR